MWTREEEPIAGADCLHIRPHRNSTWAGHWVCTGFGGGGEEKKLIRDGDNDWGLNPSTFSWVVDMPLPLQIWTSQLNKNVEMKLEPTNEIRLCFWVGSDFMLPNIHCQAQKSVYIHVSTLIV